MKWIDKTIIKLAAPVFVGHFLSFLYGIADTIFVSMLDRKATAFVSGIGLIMPINLLALAMGTGLMAGTASLVARALGARDEGTVARAGKAAVGLGIGGALIVGATMFAASGILIDLLAGTSVDFATKEAARTYLRFVAPGYALLIAELAFLGLLLGEGKTALYGSAMILGTILNLLLDPLFLFVFHLGVAGAAMATSVSSILSALYVVIVLSKEADRFGFGKKAIVNDGSMKDIGAASEIARVGFPQALSLLVVSLSFLFLNRVMANFGANRLNAWIVVGRVEECVLMIGYAVGNAAMILAGNFWGAGKGQELEALTGRCVRTALALSALVIIPYMLAAPIIFRAFSGSAEVVRACGIQVRATSWATSGVVVSLVAMSALQGMGKALPSFGLVTLRLGVFLILPVAALETLGVLNFPLFLTLFALANCLGGLVSVITFSRYAKSLPRALEPVVSSVSA